MSTHSQSTAVATSIVSPVCDRHPHIRITYEPPHGLAYIYLVDGEARSRPARSEWAFDGNVLFDLDEQGRLLGIEVLDTRAVLRDETLEGAEVMNETYEELARARLYPEDRRMLAASRGDRQALGNIALLHTRMLHEEARVALGPAHEQDAGDVVQEFFLGLAEARFTYPQLRGAAIPWMRRTVRALAAEHASHRGPDLGRAG